jgi:hypothetical protein
MPDIQTIASLLAKPNTSNENYLDREEKRRLLAFEQIQKLASDTKTPIYSTSAGVLKLATGALGGYLEGKTERDAQAAQAQNSALQARWLNLLSGGGDPGATPAPVSPPAIDTSDVPASPVSAPPMGALPGFGPVADSSPPFSPQPSVGDPFPANKIYDPGEMTPLDAAVATPEERAAPVPFQHVPDAPRIVPIPSAPAVDGSLAFASPMSPAVPPGGLDQGTVFNPSLPGGLSEGSTVLPNATVKPVSIGPNGEVSSLAPSGPFANDPVPRPPADIPNPMPEPECAGCSRHVGFLLCETV